MKTEKSFRVTDCYFNLKYCLSVSEEPDYTSHQVKLQVCAGLWYADRRQTDLRFWSLVQTSGRLKAVKMPNPSKRLNDPILHERIPVPAVKIPTKGFSRSEDYQSTHPLYLVSTEKTLEFL